MCYILDTTKYSLNGVTAAGALRCPSINRRTTLRAEHPRFALQGIIAAYSVALGQADTDIGDAIRLGDFERRNPLSAASRQLPNGGETLVDGRGAQAAGFEPSAVGLVGDADEGRASLPFPPGEEIVEGLRIQDAGDRPKP